MSNVAFFPIVPQRGVAITHNRSKKPLPARPAQPVRQEAPMKRYSVFAIAREAARYHMGWERAWAS
ncbi:MAG: hypothetical protein V4630_18890, partial [Pseudomonadota bacterium]